MLAEPVGGQAPVFVEGIGAHLKTLKAAGVAILLVEQNLEVCTQLADRHYIIEQGAIAHEASNTAFLSDDAVKDRYLGVGIA
jgi:branched-chain amino acid transport system ATP-binding protein